MSSEAELNFRNIFHYMYEFAIYHNFLETVNGITHRRSQNKKSHHKLSNINDQPNMP